MQTTKEIEARKSKPYLLYKVGDVVYLKSDRARETPMTIIYLLPDGDSDYKVMFISRGKSEFHRLPQDALILHSQGI